MTSLELADLVQLLSKVHVPRQKRLRWLAWSQFSNAVLPRLSTGERDEASRMISKRFRV